MVAARVAAAVVGLALVLAMAASSSARAAEDYTEIRILSTNDIHSYLRPVYYRYLDEMKPWGPQSREGDYLAKAGLEGKMGGMAYVATVINRLREEKPDATLLVDAGDTWHGAGITVVDKGVSMVKIMNAIGYDAMAPGNWEFFYKKDHLLELVEQADFPVLAFNVTDEEWDERVFEPYVIEEVGGLQVAIVGMTYPWTALTSAVRGSAQHWNFGIKEEAARELLDQIREEHDPDLVLVVSHGGFGLDQKFAQRVDGIDVLASGHTHDPIYDPVVWKNTIIYQGGAHGKYVTRLDVRVKDKKLVAFSYELVKVQQSELEPDPEIQRLVDAAYAPHAAKLDEVVGESKVMIYRRDYWQSPMGNMLTDALRELTGADVSFFPAWRYGATLLPGKITVEDVYNVVPTDGTINTFKMSGKALTRLVDNTLNGFLDRDPYSRVGGDMMRFSGMKLVYDISRPYGQRIVSLEIGGAPVADDKIYTVASVHTRFQNNPIFQATDAEDTGRLFVDELIEYIKKHSPVSPSLDDRIQPVDATS
ncbi:MAG: bifunctional metallophosphatase/5'-nucleotidase [Gammaproteobacteria bacterium]|nr:bifunctional metallophosphatase/5'-nucleotidase [Gammaproteobacteria bacterium]